MKYNTFIEKKSWGICTHLVAKDGLSLGAIEVLNDEPDTAYIYCVFVYESARRQGRANEILQVAEDYLTKHTNTKYVLLDAHKGWLSDWYQSKGYHLYKYNREDDLNMFSKVIEGN